ncbi:9975_t:CDS:2, partial [Dentiscutata erythropus]
SAPTNLLQKWVPCNSCNTKEVQKFINDLKKNEDVYSAEAEEIYDDDQERPGKRHKKA